jgi:hypothetical protein
VKKPKTNLKHIENREETAKNSENEKTVRKQ